MKAPRTRGVSFRTAVVAVSHGGQARRPVHPKGTCLISAGGTLVWKCFGQGVYTTHLPVADCLAEDWSIISWGDTPEADRQ